MNSMPAILSDNCYQSWVDWSIRLTPEQCMSLEKNLDKVSSDFTYNIPKTYQTSKSCPPDDLDDEVNMSSKNKARNKAEDIQLSTSHK